MTEKLSLPFLLRRGDVYWLNPQPSFIETTRMVIVIPMTSSTERWIQQLPGTIAINLHSELTLKEKFPIVLVYQMRAIDVRCSLQKNFAGRILDSDLQRIDKKLKEILGL